jgi:hypothetical protein
MKFYLQCASYNNERLGRYAQDLREAGYEVTQLVAGNADSGFQIMFIIEVKSMKYLLRLMDVVDFEIILGEDEPYYFKKAFPEYDFPKYKIIIYDDYIE